jgi:hypothetical protein
MKKRKRAKDHKKQKRARKRMPRVRVIRGPLQMDLPLQMPLFAEVVPGPVDTPGEHT